MSVDVDCADPRVVAHVFMRTNPHEIISRNRERLRWATKEVLEDGWRGLLYILAYDKAFGKCPDNTVSLKTWIATNPKNNPDNAKVATIVNEDIDTIDAYEIDGVLPAVEVVIESFVSEAKKTADNTTYRAAIKILGDGSYPQDFPKELKSDDLTATEIAALYVRHRWQQEPKLFKTVEGDWIENVETVGRMLDEHLYSSEGGRIHTGFNGLDSTTIIGKKFLKWIGILGFTNHGKTAFLLPLLYNMASFGHNILLIPREQSVEESWSRLIWMHAHFYKDLPICTLSTWLREPKAVTQADVDAKDFLINDLKNGGKILGSIDVIKLDTWEEIEEYVEVHHKEKNYSVVAVDYMGRLHVKARTADIAEAKKAMFARAQRWTQNFNNGEGMVVITPLQANREGAKAAAKHTDEGVYEDTSAVHSYSETAQDMDLIIGVWHIDALNMKISCAKTRGQQFAPFLVTVDNDRSRYVYDPLGKYNARPSFLQSKPRDLMTDDLTGDL